MKTIIVSIDTGEPTNSSSTSAIVRMEFEGTEVVRTAITYTGSFTEKSADIMNISQDADLVVLEKIDSTNKYLARSVIREQLELLKWFRDCGFEPYEMIRSGRKEVITDALMKKINLWSDGNHKTHHNDVRDATRNGLYAMAKDENLNKILSYYVQHFF